MKHGFRVFFNGGSNCIIIGKTRKLKLKLVNYNLIVVGHAWMQILSKIDNR